MANNFILSNDVYCGTLYLNISFAVYLQQNFEHVLIFCFQNIVH